jgi:hypothetical protein
VRAVDEAHPDDVLAQEPDLARDHLIRPALQRHADDPDARFVIGSTRTRELGRDPCKLDERLTLGGIRRCDRRGPGDDAEKRE